MKATFQSIFLRFIFACSLLCVETTLSSKTILWDLGGTLITLNHWSFSWHTGRIDSLGYVVLDGGNFQELKAKMFEILHALDDSQANNLHIKDAEGNELPIIMCEWLAGTINGQTIIEHALALTQALSNYDYFVSYREQRLIENCIITIFDAPTFSNCFEPLHKNVKLLNQCAQQKDSNGNPLHTMILVSNFDVDSFQLLYQHDTHQSIFQNFNEDYCVISGTLKNYAAIKPHTAFFERVLEYYNLDPADCILIDDQPENRIAAEQVGIVALPPDRTLKKQLRNLSVL